jgi:hypothetical protein
MYVQVVRVCGDGPLSYILRISDWNFKYITCGAANRRLIYIGKLAKLLAIISSTFSMRRLHMTVGPEPLVIKLACHHVPFVVLTRLDASTNFTFKHISYEYRG